MDRKIWVPVISLVASVITILVFLTGRNLPDLVKFAADLWKSVSSSSEATPHLKAEPNRPENSSKRSALELLYTLQGFNYDNLALSADGSYLAAASGWKSPALIWESSTRNLVTRLQHESVWVGGLAFSPNGKTVAMGSNRKIILWSLGGKRESVFETRTASLSVDYSPTGNLLAAGGNDEVVIWDVSTKKRLAILQVPRSQVSALAFSPDGKYLAVGGIPARLWRIPGEDTDEFEPVRYIGPNCFLVELSFSSDSNLLAGSCNGGPLWLGRVSDGEVERTIELEGSQGGLGAIEYSPRGTYLAVARGDRLELRDASGTRVVAKVKMPDGGASWSIDFSDDGRHLATSARSFAKATTEIHVWNVSYD